MADPLDFGVDLSTVQARLLAMGYFLSVTDALDASEALDGTLAYSPPAAFVAVTREVGLENRVTQGHSQRVEVEIGILFVESTARASRTSAKDQLELTRKAVTRQLVAWTPRGAGKALDYARYSVVKIGNGLAWGEVRFTTSYRLTI